MKLFGGLGGGKEIFKTAAGKSGALVEMNAELREQLHACLLEMYRDIKAACDRYDIKVFLGGGSALGAVRHKGFIPWDDDLDLNMTRADYRRFCRIFEKELGDKYILNAPNYSACAKNRFPRIMKKDSYFRNIIDTKDDELHKIYIDLFILENCPDSKVLRKIKGTYCNLLYVISWLVFIYENRDERMKEFLCSAGKMNYYVRIAAGKLFSYRKSCRWFDRFDRAVQHRGNRSRELCAPSGRKRYFGEIMRREQWLPGSECEFEGERALIATDGDHYLRHLFGENYMELPPEDKRERHNMVEIRFHA